MRCIVDRAAPVAIVRLELEGWGELRFRTEGRSGLEVNWSVERSSTNYGVGIERILRLFVVLMMGFDVDCPHAGHLEICRELRTFSDEVQKLDVRHRGRDINAMKEASLKLFF